MEFHFLAKFGGSFTDIQEGRKVCRQFRYSALRFGISIIHCQIQVMIKVGVRIQAWV